MRRVTDGPVLVLSCGLAALDRFWLNEYASEVIAVEARCYPSIDAITTALGGRVEVLPVATPLDCTNGFQEAYYGRPELFMDQDARLACSARSLVDAAVQPYLETVLGGRSAQRCLGSRPWPVAHPALLSRCAAADRGARTMRHHTVMKG
jgi:hypothetical protein